MPPTRLTVAESTERHFIIKRPGGGSGPWNPLETKYMVEPMNRLSSRLHSAVVFVGPAQSGKTAALGEGWLAHAVTADPGDMAIFQMTQDKAREYSKQRIDRMIRNSPALKRMLARSQDDNTHDKMFSNGMWLRIAWPTATNMASTSYRYVFGTDYDRWPQDIDGEGEGFALMAKRVTTFLSRGMVCAESSPGYDIKDPRFRVQGHEAPPVGGICGLYNTSDRCRWYWACPHCRERFEARPGLSLFRLPEDDELIEEVRTLDIDRFVEQHAKIACPKCEGIIPRSAREGMNHGGVWLAEGLEMDRLGRVSGNARTSSIAGYYLGGVAASYIRWDSLIDKHLRALLKFSLTGDEEGLKTTANVDQCVPYLPRHLAMSATGGDGPVDRAEADLQRYVVPPWTRFLVAAVDVQGGQRARFEVQVHAVGEHLRQQLVDRYAITKSRRLGPAGDFAPIDPAGHAEDWDLLTEHVVRATYRTEDAGREIRVYRTGVDSGGEDGVTDKAYAWYRRLRDAGEHQRVRLLKGANGKYEWHTREVWVGGKQGKGDVPLHLLDANKFKDIVFNNLRLQEPGPGYYHFPAPRGPTNPTGWLPAAFFDELFAEVRQENGTYRQVRARNESLDLCCYIRAVCMLEGCDRRGFWIAAPAWASSLDQNSEVMLPEERRAMKEAEVAPSGRRTRRSAYLA